MSKRCRFAALFLFFFLTGIVFCAAGRAEESATLPKAEIRVRDPFVLADKSSGTYFLYVQSKNRAGSDYSGVEVYTSRDLENWTPPKPVLKLPKSMNILMVWAPEVHYYNDKYYLFVTLTFRDKVASPPPVEKNWPPMYRRGTWIYRADSPLGPFEPLKNGSITPPEWMALDGTLAVQDGKPYMIFCHEWVQIIDGTFDAIELKSDLSDSVGEPKTLFAASAAPGGTPGNAGSHVSDGPFLYRSPKSGALWIIWSTFLPDGYAVIAARSESGRIEGPWNKQTPIYTKNGGHGMIFTSLDGRLLLALHQPNTPREERLATIELLDDGDSIRVKTEQ